MSKTKFQVVIPDYKYWRQNIKCQTGCPVNTDSRGYVRAIASGDYEKAYWIARTPNPLASICGRVCGAPCEIACRRGWIDAAVSIRALKRFVTEKYGVEAVLPPGDYAEKFRSIYKEKGDGIHGIAKNKAVISIVGSGPAGLACAHDLALMGYRPVIYEMERVAGGMCAVGIPIYRLPRELLQAEIDAIQALGAEIRLGVQVGKDVALKKLYDESAAVLLAVGARRSRILPVEGSESRGVLGGVEFLRDVSIGSYINIGPRVVVVGGGNVAYDVARTAVRQRGVDSVSLVCVEAREQMLADKVEIEEGEEEGVVRLNSFGPQRINAGAGGIVESMTFKKVISVFDSEGKFNPRYDESETMTLQTDTVIFSVGQAYDLSFLDKSGLEVERSPRGMIQAGADGISTSLAKLFVAGDLAYGPKLIIDAVASGKKAARKIHEMIASVRLKTVMAEDHLELAGNNVPQYQRYEKIPRVGVPAFDPAERIRVPVSQVEKGFDREPAEKQGGRCLNCAVNTIFNGDRCILCGGCADVCPEYCLRLVSLENIRGDSSLEKLYEMRYGTAVPRGGSAIIKDEERCIRCALCAKRCPVQAITMERFVFKEEVKCE
ncbi:MAG: FAD-dependent oxidoreductase [bacterium]